MKIREVKAHLLRAKLAAPFAYSRAWYDERWALIVEVVSDEGLSGFGEVYGPARMNAVNPAPGQISQGGQVCFLGQHLGLEPTHLAGGGCRLRHGPATDDPAQGRIVRQPVGIVHVFVPGEPTEDGLTELSDQSVTAILAGPGVGENLSS